jgi:hypothetical protein
MLQQVRVVICGFAPCKYLTTSSVRIGQTSEFKPCRYRLSRLTAQPPRAFLNEWEKLHYGTIVRVSQERIWRCCWAARVPGAFAAKNKRRPKWESADDFIAKGASMFTIH